MAQLHKIGCSLRRKPIVKRNSYPQYNKKSTTEKIEYVCSQTYNIINTAKQALIEDVKEEALRRRTADFLDDGLTIIEELRCKYNVNALSAQSPCLE
jgi:hypothetical protein